MRFIKLSNCYIAAVLLIAGCATADKQVPMNTINQEEVMAKMSL